MMQTHLTTAILSLSIVLASVCRQSPVVGQEAGQPVDQPPGSGRPAVPAQSEGQARSSETAGASSVAATDDVSGRLQLPPAWLKGLQWRSIGPTSMGGRIVDLAVRNPAEFYVATASGGLFRTRNGGVSFEAQFQHQSSISLGAVAVSASDPDIVWVGTGENNARNSVSWGDGVYKSTDGGQSWTNMGLRQTFQIGGIVIHPQNPDIVLVGALGRLWGRSDERGIYKTIDGGKTWKQVLWIDDMTGCVELVMHPSDPNVLLAAMYERQRDPFDGGDPAKRFGWGSGLFKSTDGGETWRRISQGLPSVKLGRIGLDYQLANPQIVYALVESERIGSGPEVKQAFMGVQGAPQGPAKLLRVTPESPAAQAGIKEGDIIVGAEGKPITAYAQLVQLIRSHQPGDKIPLEVERGAAVIALELTLGESRGGSGQNPFRTRLGGQHPNLQDRQGPEGFQTGGLFKSTDGGETWKRVNSLNPRPFYFSQVRVDPQDEQRVFVLGISLHASQDGGVTFQNVASSTHPDHHAMWINPDNPRQILLGCDGGVNLSVDGGTSWDFLDHMPIGQFYHVAVDRSVPYRVYGGLQDNGSWGGPSASRTRLGPTADDWTLLGWGDGFVCQADPEDPNTVYYEAQYGAMNRLDLATGARAAIRPPRSPNSSERFNWKTPYLLSHHNSRIFYCAGTRVYRSLDRGRDLRPISQSLVSTDQGTCTALAESPRNPDVLYCGTDDGNLWVTTDGGGQWSQLTLPDLPGPRRVQSLEASRFVDGRCYIVLDGHYYNDDRPYVLVTENFGKSWRSLVANLPVGSTRVLREDVENPDLLYLGTEFGVFASLDRGGYWNRINHNLPHVAVHEIAVHPTAGEIVAATHGRSLWILDVTTLRQIDGQVLGGQTHFFSPKPAIAWQSAVGRRYFGERRFHGENPPPGAQLSYSLKERAQRISLTIRDVEGQVVNQLRGPTAAGLHTISWNLTARRQVPGDGRPGGSPAQRGGPRPRGGAFSRARPGEYLVTLQVDGQSFSRRLELRADPLHSADSLTFDEDELLRKLDKTGDD